MDSPTIDQLTSLVGPITTETNGFLPAGQTLPFTIHFHNAADAAQHVGEVRVTQQIDEGLDLNTFALGDLQVGQIRVHIPAGRATFQGDFDFTQTQGFVLRVSAGVDLDSRMATWLLQAIDPLTGEILQATDRGLLAPNNPEGDGVGLVGYTIQLDGDASLVRKSSRRPRFCSTPMRHAVPSNCNTWPIPIRPRRR